MNTQQTPTVNQIKAQAAAFLQRRDFGEWTTDDAAELEAWLEQSHAHAAAYWRLEAAWEQTYRLPLLGRGTTDVTRARLWTFSVLIRAAAVIAAVTVIGGGAWTWVQMPHDRIYSTPVGGHEIVKFADGSEIELNTSTQLRTRMTTVQRTVWLDRGEAFFHVKHNAAHPLTVVAGNRRIIDLGTQFLVRRNGTELKVALLEGRVRIGGINLTPGEEVVATAHSLVVSHKSAEDLTNEIAWRNGVLVFRHATLSEAVKAFNRYSERKLLVPDPEIGKRTVGGTFRTDNVDGFIAVVRDLLGLRVANESNNIVITR